MLVISLICENIFQLDKFLAIELPGHGIKYTCFDYYFQISLYMNLSDHSPYSTSLFS